MQRLHSLFHFPENGFITARHRTCSGPDRIAKSPGYRRRNTRLFQLKWYEEMLGFEVTHRDEPNATVMMMNDYKIVFCLVLSFDIEHRRFPRNNYQVEQYFNFHTEDADDAYRTLKDKGAERCNS
jgi:hypothetical protein